MAECRSKREQSVTVAPADLDMFGRLNRFIRKPPHEQASAVFATALDLYRQLRSYPTRRLLVGGLAVPKVLSSRHRMYVACRPDWDVDFDCHPELRGLAGDWVSDNLENNAGDLPRLYALLLNVSQVMQEGIPGDFAELGVYRGNSAAVLVRYARRFGRTVFLFDTYQGFAQNDLTGVDEEKQPTFGDTSLGLVQRKLGTDSVVYVAGYFPDTVTKDIADRRYAIVHLDCDLYAPIKAGIAFFYERLSPGGIIIIHDYANPCWEGTKRAVDEFLPHIAESLVLIPDKSGTAIIRKSRLPAGPAL
jgi:Macrocin-O-methyltransferase (TylF)